MADEVDVDELNLLLGSVVGHTDESEDRDSGVPAETNVAAPLAGGDAAEDTKAAEKRRNKKEKKHKKKEGERKREREEATGEEDDDDDEDRRQHSKYVLDAAESTSGEDGDSFVDEEEEESGGEAIPMYRPQEQRLLFDAQLTDEQLGQQYEERARMMKARRNAAGVPREDLERGGGGGKLATRQRLTSLRYTSQMLPQPSDPKVFAVKCKPRMARILVGRILNKCYAYRMGKNLERKIDLGIISVFSLDHVKEYIYMEAHRQIFVTNALEGLVGVFRFNISQVQPAELMQMMEHKPSNEKVKVGALVRLRQRPYRGDLAQVVGVVPDGRHITVKVVPREDFVGRTYQKVTTVLPQRFFSPEQALDAEDRGDHYRWGDLKFDREGYLLKTVSIRSVSHGPQMSPVPDGQELATFYNNNREQVREAVARYAVEGSRLAESIRIGDTVKVITGQLKNTVGAVSNIMSNTSTAVLSCKLPNRKTPVSVRVELTDCTKHFPEGTHLVVEDGEYKGMSGTVVKSYGEVVVLFCDRDGIAPEITVKANDCYQSKLTSTMSGGSGGGGVGMAVGRQLYDLVRLSDSRTVGCVVVFQPDSVEVLTEQNERRRVSDAQMKPVGRVSKKALDAFQNVLVRGAEVTIRSTDLTPLHLRGTSGRIEQVFNDTVFISIAQLTENAGLVALPAKCTVLTGGRKTTQSTTTQSTSASKLLPVPQRRPHNAVMADYPSDLRSNAWQHSSEYVEDSLPLY